MKPYQSIVTKMCSLIKIYTYCYYIKASKEANQILSCIHKLKPLPTTESI